MQRPGMGASDPLSKETKAAATKLFEAFFHAETLETTLAAFSRVKECLGIKEGRINQFYPIMKVGGLFFV